MSKVFLFVEVNVKPGKMDEFVNKIKAHAAVIRTEAGCEFLDIYRDTQKWPGVSITLMVIVLPSAALPE